LFHVDPFRILDYKLRSMAKTQRSWSMSKVGSVRLQLAVAREVIHRFDVADESRDLAAEELELHNELKLKCLGLSSLSRTIARQRSRLLFLRAGDANTKFFHLQSCHRQRKKCIQSMSVEGNELRQNRQMASAVFEYFDRIMGTSFGRARAVCLGLLDLPTLDLSALDCCFSEQEIKAIVDEIPADNAPGPDGFTGQFYKCAWQIIHVDIINAFNAFWSLDSCSFNLVNDAFMVLLQKKSDPQEIKDYRPISLMHSFGKLVAKCLSV
jgi:hypothetical protein